MVLRLILLLTLTFSKLYKVECVTCTYTLTSISIWGYGCQLNNQVVESESDLVTINGDHMTGFDDGDVIWIATANSRISFFPSLLVERFPNVTHASFHKSQMTSFGPPISCGRLEYIGLDDNLLPGIPDGIFAYCSSLKKLDLNGNNLGSISKDALSALTKLTSLNIMRSNISSIHPEAFSSLVNLRDIDLNSNELESLDSNLFRNSTRLNIVRLDNNHLSSLPEDMFARNSFVYHLNLSDNRLTSIGSTVFDIGDFAYGSLDLSNNLIEELPMFEGNIFLQQLNLGSNKIRRITPGTFRDSTFLNELNLANNYIEELLSGTFNGLLYIQFLYLNSNNITELQPDTFTRFSFLYELWLSDNQLKHLNASSLATAYSLRVFQAERNQIVRIDREIFDVLPNLAILNLTGNVCANESYFINWEDREKRIFPTLGTCGTSSRVTLRISVLSFLLIVLLRHEIL